MEKREVGGHTWHVDKIVVRLGAKLLGVAEKLVEIGEKFVEIADNWVRIGEKLIKLSLIQARCKIDISHKKKRFRAGHIIDSLSIIQIETVIFKVNGCKMNLLVSI